MKKRSRRKAALSLLILSLCLLLAVTLAGVLLRDAAMETDFARKNLPPSLRYPFGTDWMGRDLFVRTLCGLSMSIQIGIITASVSAVIAFLLGSAAALLGRGADAAVSWLIDLMMGIPHILLLILVSFACGKGFSGGGHWRNPLPLDVPQPRHPGGGATAPGERLRAGGAKAGHGPRIHPPAAYGPHLFPQFMVGLVLLFPHAILHEASVTFLGFGLSPEQPAIGVILSEGMKYLIMGQWWLAVFPGLALVLVVLLFDLVGSTLRKLLDPASIHSKEAAMERPILEVEHLSLSFTQYRGLLGRTQLPAISDLSLRIHPGSWWRWWEPAVREKAFWPTRFWGSSPITPA